MLHLTHQQLQEMIIRRPVASDEELGYDLYHTRFESTIDEPICKGSTKSVVLREGITFLQVEVTFLQDTEVEMRSTQPQVGFCYCLKGRSTAYVHRTGQEQNELALQYAERLVVIYANPSSSGYQHYWAHDTVKAFFIHFSYDSFLELLGAAVQDLPRELANTLDTGTGSYYYLTPMSHDILALCLSLENNTFKGKSREFFIEAKVFEIIAYQIESLTRQLVDANGIQPPLTRREEEQIDYSYQMLQTNLGNPPSLLELARGTGMSVYRLKNGFRYRYGFTPFRLLTELRMLHAKELLQKGELNISEVAFAVGYSSLGTFSNTFHERFGVRPSALKKL